jgi:predicted lipid-binding transport protein (Tim44 family)
MVKFTHSKGKLNGGLAIGAVLGAAIPILAVAATGGLAAVPISMWIALGGVVSGLLAGNVEPKTALDRALDRDAAKTSVDTDGE